MVFDNWGITEKSAYEIAEKALTNINNGGKGVVDKLYDLITKPFKEQVVSSYNNHPSSGGINVSKELMGLIDEALGSKGELQETIDGLIKHNISTEKILDKLANHVSLVFDNAYKGLMLGVLDDYKKRGIEKYRYITREDARVCVNCKRLNDKEMKVENAVIGVNFPPMHFFCRCITQEVNSNVEIQDDSKYYDSDGNPKWPDDDGFDGEPETITLQQGTKIDRYGDEDGYFSAPKGTPYNKRSLPRGTDQKEFHEYEIMKPVGAKSGKTKPWFNEPGGGTQYKFDKKIIELIEEGYLRRIR